MAKGKYQMWLTEEGLTKIKGWAMDGLTDEDIAHNMGIHTATLYEWKNKYDEINEALSLSKEVADRIVENSVYKRACGYDTWEEKQVWNEELGEWVPIERKLKHVPADTNAAQMWLRNRKRDKWGDTGIDIESTETGIVLMPKRGSYE